MSNPLTIQTFFTRYYNDCVPKQQNFDAPSSLISNFIDLENANQTQSAFDFDKNKNGKFDADDTGFDTFKRTDASNYINNITSNAKHDEVLGAETRKGETRYINNNTHTNRGNCQLYNSDMNSDAELTEIWDILANSGYEWTSATTGKTEGEKEKVKNEIESGKRDIRMSIDLMMNWYAENGKLDNIMNEIEKRQEASKPAEKPAETPEPKPAPKSDENDDNEKVNNDDDDCDCVTHSEFADFKKNLLDALGKLTTPAANTNPVYQYPYMSYQPIQYQMPQQNLGFAGLGYMLGSMAGNILTAFNYNAPQIPIWNTMGGLGTFGCFGGNSTYNFNSIICGCVPPLKPDTPLHHIC